MSANGPLPQRRFLLVLAVLIAAASFWLIVRHRIDPEAAGSAIRSAATHWWAPFAFIGAYLLLALFVVPLFPLSVVAALTWGWAAGGLIELAAAWIASIAPYALARSGVRTVLGGVLTNRFSALDKKLEAEGFITLLLLRLVQVPPYSVLNYLSGAARVRFRDYAAATVLGLIPPIFIFTYLVDSVAAGTLKMQDAWLRVALGSVVAGVFALLCRWLVRRFRLDVPQ